MLLRNQNGFTLLELLMVVVITSMMIVAIGTFSVNIINNYQYSEAQVGSSNDILNIMDRMTKVVRGTTKLVTTGSTSLTFYGYFSPRDSVPDLITYSVSATSLQSSDTVATGTGPNYTYDTSGAVVRTLATNLAVGSTPIFTYYDDLGNLLTGAFSASQVKQIGIYVAVNPHPARVPIAISNQTRVTLRNMKTNL